MMVGVALRPLPARGSQPQPGCARQAGVWSPRVMRRCPSLGEPVPSHTGLGVALRLPSSPYSEGWGRHTAVFSAWPLVS